MPELSQTRAMPQPVIDIAVDDDGDWGADEPAKVAQVALVAAWRRLKPRHAAEISVVLASDDDVRSLNRDFRGKDKPTNVLSFPQDGAAVFADEAPAAPLHLGDIVLARETVLREARDGSVDPSHHIAHLVVHGFLHLVGYTHDQDEAAETMEGLESEILTGLGLPDPNSKEPDRNTLESVAATVTPTTKAQ